MPLTPMQLFHCDFKGDENQTACEVEFYYNPQPVGPQVPGLPPQFDWSPEIRQKLTDVVATTLPITGHTTFYCGAEHAILAMAANQHLPEEVRKVAPANAADLAALQRGMGIVSDMRKGKPS